MQNIFRTTLYSHVLVKYNVWKHDFMLETLFFFGVNFTEHAH